MISTDLFKIGMPESIKEKQKEEAIKQAMKNLLSEKIFCLYLYNSIFFFVFKDITSNIVLLSVNF